MVTAAVAMSRDRTSAAEPAGCPLGRQEALAGGPDEQREPEVLQLVQPFQQRPVVLGALGETQTRVQHERVGADPGGQRRLDARRELGPDVGRPRPRTRHGRSSSHCGARQCISTHGSPASATTAAIPGSASPPDTSLISAAPAAAAAAATEARVVSTEHGTPARLNSVDDRQHPGGLDVGIDPVRTGTGRLATDVDEVRTGGVHGQAVRDGGIGGGEQAAVGEGVGRDVQDAHHPQPTRRRRCRQRRRRQRRDVPAWPAHRRTMRAHRLRPGRLRGLEDARVPPTWRSPQPALRTPRTAMHRCSASSTTITPAGSQPADHRLGDLGGEPLLDLRSPGVALDDPGQLRQAGHPTVAARDVARRGPCRRTAAGGARRWSRSRCRAPGSSRRGSRRTRCPAPRPGRRGARRTARRTPGRPGPGC